MISLTGTASRSRECREVGDRQLLFHTWRIFVVVGFGVEMHEQGTSKV